MQSSVAECVGPDRDTEWGPLPCLMDCVPSLSLPHLALLLRSVPCPVLSTHFYLLPPATCFALVLLCFFKEHGCEGGGYGVSSQHPEVTQLCVIQRARPHPLPWTGHERRVVAVQGP